MTVQRAPGEIDPSIPWPDKARQQHFAAWIHALREPFGLDLTSLAPASADASFRRYLRVRGQAGSYVVMDAPPEQEDVRPFVRIAAMVRQAGLNAPEVHACDAERGFLLLSDLGRELYLDALRDADGARTDRLMRDALAALVRWQAGVDSRTLPPLDEALLREELALFPEWCVEREFGRRWSERERAAWDRVCGHLVASALAQPQVAVHKDWMVRNLMVCEPAAMRQGEEPGTRRTPGPNPGILDFQDAVCGPLTYDLASMLRDAFISFDEEREIDWAVRWWQQARAAGVPLGELFATDFGEFWRALEWMGLQRHLRVMGIFCRLKHRDGKPHYVQDLPRFLAYAGKVAMRYPPLKPLLTLLEPLSGARVEAGFTF